MTDFAIIFMFIMAFGVTIALTVLVVALFRSAHVAEKKAIEAERQRAASEAGDGTGEAR